MPSANPFYHRTPIRDPAHFFGRGEELRQLHTLLANGQSVSIIGPRRIGKSSLLHQLTPSVQPTTDGRHTKNHCVVYFSGEGWQDQPAQVLYAALWAAIVDTITATAETDTLPADLPAATVAALDFPTFQRALRQLRNAAPQLILLLDEFDTLSRNGNLDEVFFSTLRSLVATHGITYVTASTVPLLELTYAQQSALSSPFFNIFLPQRLGLLTDAEAAELVVGTAALGGLSLADEQCDSLVQLAGPHPFFLQIAGYHWWAGCNEQGTVEAAAMHQAMESEAFAHWTYLWRYLSTAEQRLLALLRVEPAPASTTAQRLHHACLLRTVDGVNSYLSLLLERFVHQQQIHGIVQAGPLLLDQERHLAWLAHEPLALAPQDYRLLEVLGTHAETSLSYATLGAALWPDEQTVINHQSRLKAAVSSLRQKLGNQSDLILTDPAGGYRLQSESGPPSGTTRPRHS